MDEGLDQQISLVKQREAELKEMQDQIESYNQMVKQLASQREMAVKRLADMDGQIEELNKMLESERLQVEAKDKDLKTKRTLLQTLKDEENELKLQEKQIELKLTELQQFLTSTNAAIEDLENAITYKDTIKLSALCNQELNPLTPLSTNTVIQPKFNKNQDASNDPLFEKFDPFANDDPFEGDDPFESEDSKPALPEDDPFNPWASKGPQ